MEKFKTYKEITKTDNRNLVFVKIDAETGEKQNIKSKDIYDFVASITLNDDIPDEVLSQFNVAKNLVVYSWFSYPFHQIAEMKAYSTLEMALKIKFGQKGNGLKRLLEKAVSSGLIKDKEFSHISHIVEDKKTNKYAKILPETISILRNKLAHGSNMLHPNSASTLRICADIINQLFGNN